MELRPPLNNISTEELLSSLEIADDSTSSSNPFQTFISLFKIKQGEYKVNRSLLYRLFSLWYKTKIKRNVFYLEMSNYFEERSHKYLMINISPVNILKILDKSSELKKYRKTKSSIYKRHFEKFLEENDIKSGNYFIESFILNHIYNKWMFNNYRNKSPLGSMAFLNFCNLYFENKRLTSERVSWFGVDKCFIKEGYQEIIDNLRKARKANNVKNYKKKQNKIPRLKSRI